ncbi:hypothetical protein ACFY3M_48365 [Streptomyces mirabilis]|uniref:hypothetical protein n=1 Tax=Streptomyces mirabilis TaxID=68239 RepID=UPI00368E2D91
MVVVAGQPGAGKTRDDRLPERAAGAIVHFAVRRSVRTEASGEGNCRSPEDARRTHPKDPGAASGIRPRSSINCLCESPPWLCSPPWSYGKARCGELLAGSPWKPSTTSSLCGGGGNCPGWWGRAR